MDRSDDSIDVALINWDSRVARFLDHPSHLRRVGGAVDGVDIGSWRHYLARNRVGEFYDRMYHFLLVFDEPAFRTARLDHLPQILFRYRRSREHRQHPESVR